MSSFGRDAQPLVDVAAHGAEPDVRHVQDRVFYLAPRLLNCVQIRAARRQKLQLHAVRRPISSLTNSTCAAARRRLSSGSSRTFACGLQELDKLLPGKGAVSLEEPSPSSVIRPNTMVLECDPVYV